jgi:glycosyltransferase involved in cell wall biosynthesis
LNEVVLVDEIEMRIVRYYPRALVGDGGMTSAVRNWSRAMTRCGAEAVIAYDAGVPAPDEDSVEWVEVRHAGRQGLKLPLGLEDVLRDADFLVLHSAWTLRNVRAAAAARKLGTAYVLEPRGAYDPHIVNRKKWIKRLWWVAWEKQLVHSARAIHVFFESERQHLATLGYEGPTIVASNGRDIPSGEAWDGGSGGYLLWLGRFDPEHKGLDLLLDAIDLLPVPERPDLRLHGPDWRGKRSLVGRWIAERKLGEWVRVGEAVYGDQKRHLLTRASGFVYPSRWDACPNSVLESVGLGVPTLVTPYPLGRFLSSRGGAVLAEANAEDLAEGLRRLGDRDADDVGRIGAEVVRDQLGWDSVARTWLDQAEALL